MIGSLVMWEKDSTLGIILYKGSDHKHNGVRGEYWEWWVYLIKEKRLQLWNSDRMMVLSKADEI